MEVIEHERRQMIRRVTSAQSYESELAGVDSWESGIKLVAKSNRTVRQRGRELIEANFWLGGAIAKAESYSEWGDAFFATLEKDAGISSSIARRSMRLWDLFGGDVVELHIWCARFIEEHGKVLVSDVNALIESNRKITDGRQSMRGLKARLIKREMPAALIESSGLMARMEKRDQQLDEMEIRSPVATMAPEAKMPTFKHVRTLKAARQKLVFDPDEPVIIDEVSLADGVTYEVVVSLRPKQ